MAQFVIANNVNTQLAAALPASGAGSTTVVLASSANLPTLNTATGQMMPLTLNDAATGAIYETVYVTAISGATCTVLRGQEGTSALNWNVGDFAFCGPTAGTVGLTTMRTQYQASASFSSSQTLTAAIAGESVGFTGTSAATFSMPGQSTVPSLTPTAVYNDGTTALTLTANGSDKFVVATGQVTSIVMQPGDDLSFYASTTSGQWQATAGSALRQYEPLVVGAATASQHAMQFGQATGRWISRVIYATAGTFSETPPANATLAVYDVNGGGGGGGAGAGTAASQIAAGAGGGAGGRAIARVANPTTQTITVGANGLGATSGSATNGGSSSVGSIASATGGTAGVNGTAGSGGAGVGGLGGTGTGGNINVRGSSGGNPFGIGSLGFVVSGAGANSLYGSGGVAQSTYSTGGTATGNASGGGGGCVPPSNSGGASGGNGAPGIVVIDYYT